MYRFSSWRSSRLSTVSKIARTCFWSGSLWWCSALAGVTLPRSSAGTIAGREPVSTGIGARVELAAVGVGQQVGLVQRAVLLDVLDERLLVAVAVVAVLDLLVGAGDPAQAHDLAHRRDALRAGLDAHEAVRAVVDAVRVLGEVLEALVLLAVARIADEAVGLGERGRADEQRVDLHRQAVRHAGAALDAGHRLGDVDHVLVGDDVLALGLGALGQEPRRDALDLLPVHRVHVDDQVLDDRHVAHRLDDDRAAVPRTPPPRARGGGGRRGRACR